MRHDWNQSQENEKRDLISILRFRSRNATGGPGNASRAGTASRSSTGRLTNLKLFFVPTQLIHNITDQLPRLGVFIVEHDLAALSDGTILCLYERGDERGSELYGRITMARFTADWLRAETD